MSLYGYICCELFAVIDCFYVDIIHIDWIYNYYWFILYSESKTFNIINFNKEVYYEKYYYF